MSDGEENDEGVRVDNFLSNWIDANITNSAAPPSTSSDTLHRVFLVDAVAAGIYLDEVNSRWADADVRIQSALDDWFEARLDR